jgi:hypothetical protein
MLANAVDPVAPYDKDAKKKWDSSLNTLTGYGAEAIGLVPRGTPTFADAAANARDQRGNRTARYAADMDLPSWRNKVQEDATNQANDMYVDGVEHYERAGMPKPYAYFAGAAQDAVLDPYNGLGRAVGIAQAGKPMGALWDLVKEFGFGQAAAGLAASSGSPGQ